VARPDPLANYFSVLFEKLDLVVVESLKLVPAWRNFKGCGEGISKRLDRFLLAEKGFGGSG
jgi:hypothetical protein